MQESMPKMSESSGSMGWVVGAIVAVVLIGGYFLFANSGDEKEKSEEKAMMEKKAMEEKAMMEKNASASSSSDKAMMQKAGSYVPYDAAKLAMAKDGKVVLFFRASWCPSCRALDADIKANAAKIPANVTILDTDYDKYTDLKKKYGVTTQHTLVQVDAQGNEIAKWVGSSGLNDIVSRLK